VVERCAAALVTLAFLDSQAQCLRTISIQRKASVPGGPSYPCMNWAQAS
jgi:hypothetical protein